MATATPVRTTKLMVKRVVTSKTVKLRKPRTVHRFGISWYRGLLSGGPVTWHTDGVGCTRPGCWQLEDGSWLPTVVIRPPHLQLIHLEPVATAREAMMAAASYALAHIKRQMAVQLVGADALRDW